MRKACGTAFAAAAVPANLLVSYHDKRPEVSPEAPEPCWVCWLTRTA